MLRKAFIIILFVLTLNYCSIRPINKVADPMVPGNDSYSIEVVPSTVVIKRGKIAKFDVIIRRISGIPHTFSIVLKNEHGSIPWWFSPSQVYVKEIARKKFTINALYDAVEAGRYRVIARAVDCADGALELKEEIEILKPERNENQIPVAFINYTPSTIYESSEIVFDGSSSYDPDGYIRNYKWRIDGKWVQTGSSTLLWKFSQAGYHTVILEVVDNKGASNSTALLLEVLPR